MSSTSRRIGRVLAGAALCAALAATAGCMQSRLRQSDDFSVAVREATTAQVADPDARYRGDPAPASNGNRASLAVTRYRSGNVIRPSQSDTQSAVSTSGAPGGTAGAGAASGGQ